MKTSEQWVAESEENRRLAKKVYEMEKQRKKDFERRQSLIGWLFVAGVVVFLLVMTLLGR